MARKKNAKKRLSERNRQASFQRWVKTTSEPTDEATSASRPRPPQHDCSKPRPSSSELANCDKPIDQLQLVCIQPVEKVNKPTTHRVCLMLQL